MCENIIDKNLRFKVYKNQILQIKKVGCICKRHVLYNKQPAVTITTSCYKQSSSQKMCPTMLFSFVPNMLYNMNHKIPVMFLTDQYFSRILELFPIFTLIFNILKTRKNLPSDKFTLPPNRYFFVFLIYKPIIGWAHTIYYRYLNSHLIHKLQCYFYNVHLQKSRSRLSDSTTASFKKAFDAVSHDLLMSTLENLGVGNSLLSCLKSYVSGRRDFVSILSSSTKNNFDISTMVLNSKLTE
ncbi:hypothetical protein AGLY_011677 [Aphis glycines]|uniref:Reverse transcriptase domain-containing protein n=1 Tax=Aphis glycines TaxID=307491 RepID=A0A6G0TBH5_APHGL|nr:hypothetical protein AGLY_011677 [Aphis glycines]